MLKEKLLKICKQNNLNMPSIEINFDLNKLDEEMLKNIQTNKARFISTNLNKAEEVLTNDKTLDEQTKNELFNLLKTTDFSIVYDPNKIVDLNSLISFLMRNFQYLIDWYNIENNKLTPPNILDREVAKIANELVDLLEQTKQQPLKSAIDLVENKLNKITQATINTKRMFTLTKEDVMLVNGAFQDINNKLEDIAAEITNKQLESTLVNTTPVMEQPETQSNNDSDSNINQELVNRLGGYFVENDIQKTLETLINDNIEMKEQLKEGFGLVLTNAISLAELKEILNASKLITSFINKDLNKKEIINVTENYKLIKVE